MPQAAAAERNPRAAFTPPAMRFRDMGGRVKRLESSKVKR
jgi:hypothetical protein